LKGRGSEDSSEIEIRDEELIINALRAIIFNPVDIKRML
jgi:hypothetical protein